LSCVGLHRLRLAGSLGRTDLDTGPRFLRRPVDYATGLATCRGPLGPCRAVSRDRPWLRTSSDPSIGTNASFAGAGGLSFVTAPDGHLYAMFAAYRGSRAPDDPIRVGWVYRVAAGRDPYLLPPF
jgi:hypothetical protein